MAFYRRFNKKILVPGMLLPFPLACLAGQATRPVAVEDTGTGTSMTVPSLESMILINFQNGPMDIVDSFIGNYSAIKL